ncbi:MAG: hypothetical protein HKP38_04510 [Croceitalea sp.]|nr:hypothetical protein [Croceitalea sp.]MBT8238219.1 hypothetical protein [Croceitalea sp.]NNC33561.1 hypothetical protein [Croceitalea sp.]NNL08469.1 hypothetical protein [Croceitalea sp.]NNM18729.1 hypothetical protein [Croceitalea sp.]
MNRFFILLIVTFVFASCSNDDDGIGGAIVPPRLLSEVAPENDAELQAYLQSHFYNYEEFENPPADFDYRIRLDTIAGENASKIPLSQQVASAVINVNATQFGLSSGEENIPHTFYYLNAREGEGTNPTFADSTFVRYEGKLLSGSTFDGATSGGVWFDLARIQGPLQGARGFSEAIPKFKTGGEPISNPDGTFSVDGFGVGMMFLPSGLGYFNNPQQLIPIYSPLIFEINLLTSVTSDHDQDGIPSILEDLNGNGFLYDDNTDEEDESRAGFPFAVNFLDLDDDDDGTLTRDEIIIDEQTGEITFPDTDGDGIPDYLDKDNS